MHQPNTSATVLRRRAYCVLVKNMNSGIKLPGFKSWFCYLLDVWPWANYLISLCQFPFCYMEVIMMDEKNQWVNRAAFWLLWVLGTYALVDPFLHKGILEIVFYNCIDIKMNIIQPGFSVSYLFLHLFFFLILKEFKIQTLLWSSKSIVGPRHCAERISQPPQRKSLDNTWHILSAE